MPADPRQLQIEHDYLGTGGRTKLPRSVQKGHGLFAIGRYRQLVTDARHMEGFPEETNVGRIILDQQDLDRERRRRFALLPLLRCVEG